MKWDIEALARPVEDPRERLDTVQQQRVVRRVVDVGLRNRGVDPYLSSVLDPPGLGVQENHMIDLVPGRLRDPLDVLGQRRLPWDIERMSEPHETSIAEGVGQVERQVLVAEPRHLLDDRRPQRDVRAQARPTSSLVPRGSLILQIFPDEPRDGRVVAQDSIDHFQLTSMLVRETVVTEEVECGKDWAHPVAPILLGKFVLRGCNQTTLH